MTDENKPSNPRGFDFYVVDDYIDVYALRDSRRHTIDDYYAKATERLTTAFELHDHYYAIYDVRTGALPSPYAISISRELAQAKFSQINQSVAIVTSNSFMMTFVRSVLNRIPSQKGVNSMFFKDFQAAKAWLKEEHVRGKLAGGVQPTIDIYKSGGDILHKYFMRPLVFLAGKCCQSSRPSLAVVL